MTTELQAANQHAQILEKVIIDGDLSKLSSQERLMYYNKTCESLGLNPLTRPFEYVRLNGKLTFYARKEASEQLRTIRNVSIIKRETQIVENIYIVTTWGKLPNDREDVGIGAVAIGGLKGDALANAIMKADTKSKRRMTLSICGLGFVDESEIETIKDARVFNESQLDAPEKQQMKIEDWLEHIAASTTLDELRSVFKQACYIFKGHQSALEWLTNAKDKRKLQLEEGTQDETIVRDGEPVPPIDLPTTVAGQRTNG